MTSTSYPGTVYGSAVHDRVGFGPVAAPLAGVSSWTAVSSRVTVRSADQSLVHESNQYGGTRARTFHVPVCPSRIASCVQAVPAKGAYAWPPVPSGASATCTSERG